MIYKVMGKMFAIVGLGKVEHVILKCDPHLVESLKEIYAGVGHRSHLDQRSWISVELDSDVPADEIDRLVDQSYDLVVKTLTRKQRAELGR
jgi:predicted DNA-binding protein (MmcQ/YjbR family)